MATFTPESYFQRRFGAVSDEKIAEIQKAKADKLTALTELSQAFARNAPIALAQKEQDAQSWVGRNDVDPDSTLGSMMNLGAEFYSGTSRVMGQGVSGVAGLIARNSEMQLDQQDYLAEERALNGTATPRDIDRLNSKRRAVSPSASPELRAKAQEYADNSDAAPTVQQLLDRARSARQAEVDITEAFKADNQIHQGARRALQQDLSVDFADPFEQWKQGGERIYGMESPSEVVGGVGDAVSGMARLLFNAGEAAVNHPRASLGYIIENTPQIALGMAGKAGSALLGATNISYGSELYARGIEDFQAKNNGAMPSEEERQYLATMAATASLAEQAGDMLQIKGIKGITAAPAPMSRASFKASLENIGMEGAKNFLTEGATEGYQTYAEGEATRAPVTAEDIYSGAAIGGIAGGGMASGGRTLSEIARATPEDALRKKNEKLTHDNAVKNNDPSAYLDSASAQYSPTDAVKVLIGHAQLADTTPEVKAANLQKTQEIVKGLEEKIQGAQTVAAMLQMDEAELKVMEGKLPALKEKLAGLDPANTEEAAAVANKIAAIEEGLTASKNPIARKLHEGATNKLISELTASNSAQKILNDLVNGPVDEAEAAKDLALATAKVDQTDTAAVKASNEALNRVINLSMASDTYLDATTAKELADNKTNGLTDTQRTYLRQMSAARVAQNALETTDSVTKTIMNGDDKGNLGLTQYKAKIGQALNSGDSKGAMRYLSMLSSFAFDHAQKAEAGNAALALAKNKSQSTQIVRGLVNGTWETRDKASWIDRVTLRNNGGLVVHPGSPKSMATIERMPTEVVAINTALEAHIAAYKVKFGTKPAGISVPSKSVAAGSTVSPATPPTQTAPASNIVTPTVTPIVTKKEVPSAKTPETQQTESSTQTSAASPTKGLADATNAPSEAEGAVGAEAVITEEESSVLGLENEDQATLDEVNDILSGLKTTTVDSILEESTNESITETSDGTTDPITTESGSSSGEVVGRGNESTQQEAIKEGTEDSGTTTVDPSSKTSVEVAKDQGKLAVFGKYAKDSSKKLQDTFRSLNLIAQFFSQSGTNENNKTNRPLVAVNGFLGSWIAGEIKPEDFLALETGQQLTSQQNKALDQFKTVMARWIPSIQGILAVRPKPTNKDGSVKAIDDFVAEDMMQYLYAEDGKAVLEENVLTAMGVSAYTYIVDKASSAMYLTDKQIVKMHSKPDGTKLSSEGQKVLNKMDSLESTGIAAMGQSVIQALGLKANKDAPLDLMPKLEIALGQHVLALLQKHKYVTVTEIPSNVVNSYFGTEETKDTALRNEFETVSYISFNYAKEGNKQVLNKQSNAIRGANKGASNVIEKLFGVEPTAQLPATKPQKMAQKKAKKTDRDIPTKLRQAIQKAMDIPHTAIPEMVSVFKQLGKEGIMIVAGAKHVDHGIYHSANIESIAAKNDGLAKEVDQVLELFERDGEQGTWFVIGEVWKNFRAGISNRAVNLQSSKIHRALFKQPSWTVTINETEQPELLKEFMITVAMGLGEKTDAQRNVKSLEKYFTLRTDPTGAVTYELKNENTFAAALLLSQVLESKEEWPQEVKDLIVEVTSKEGMMSLQALVAYSKYLKAKDDGKDSFEFTLLTGADGKTNGPMLSLLAFGAAGFDTLNRGGMYKEGEASHFSEWFENPEAQDLYQHTGLTVILDLIAKLTPEQKTYQKAFEVITGSLYDGKKVTKDMRNLVKTPLTAFFFGSSVKSAVTSMETAFIEGFYTKLEKLKQKEVETGNTDPEAYKAFVDAANKLLHLGAKSDKFWRGSVPVFAVADLETAMKTELTKPQEAALRSAFQVLMGKSVASTFKSNFAQYAETRDTMNRTVQAAWHVYHSAYASARKAEMERLMDEGLVASRISVSKAGDKTRQPLHDMNADQLAVVRLRVKHLLPVLQSAYSLEEDNINVGLQMGKIRATQSTEQFYTGKNFYTSIENGTPVVRNSRVKSRVKEEIDPGVTPTSFSIHSLDSAIMHEALLAFENGLNVHDEMAMGVADMAKGAETINKAVVDKLLRYSPMREAYAMMERMVLGMALEVKQGKVEPDAVISMLQGWASAYNRGKNEDEQLGWQEVAFPLLQNAFVTANNADRKRLTNISQLYVMDQYTWEGGQYNVPPETRELALEYIKHIPKDTGAEIHAALEMLIDFVRTGKAPAIVEEQDTAPEEYTKDEVAPLVGLQTPWGVTGKPAIEPDKDLDAAFAAKPVMTAKEALRLLRDNLGTPATGQQKFMLELVLKLYSLIPDTVQVKYITSANKIGDVIQAPNTPSRGWYVADGAKKEIYLLSPEFVNSGLTFETVLHELLHAALVEATRSTSVSAKALVKELTALMDKAKEYVASPDNKMQGKFAGPLSNLDDFMAWGMTNEAFQKEVLMKIKYATKTRRSVLIQGMKGFIDAIKTYVFGTARSGTGMAVLISNVSGLLAQAEKDAAKNTATGVNLSMAAQVTAMSTLEVHDALDQGKVSPLFNTHLKNILTTVVDSLHGPFGSFKEAVSKGVASTPADVFNEAISTGVAPFTSELQASGFKFNNQTFYVAEQVEATIKTLLDSKDNRMAGIREELRKLEAEMRQKLTPQDFFKGDWFQATKDERDQATDLHSYLFKKVDGDYLARFAALGLAHEEFNTMLKVPTKQAEAVLKDRTVSGTLERIFKKTLEMANGKLTKTTPGSNADQKLESLVRSLVQIENRNKNMLKDPVAGILSFADEKVKNTRQGAKDTVSQILNSAMFKKSKIKTVAAASSLVDVIAANQVRLMFSNIVAARNSKFKEQQGETISVVSEFSGQKKDLLTVLRKGKAWFEGGRKTIIDNTNKEALAAYKDGGEYLSDDQKAAVTSVLLRTGAHVLLNNNDMKQIATLIKDPAALAKAIAATEAKLTGFTPVVKSQLIVDSMNLGHHMTTGIATLANMKQNAHNIAHLLETDHFANVSNDKKESTVPIIDELITLYALKYSRSQDLNAVSEVMAVENDRTDGNGVQMTMLTQKESEKESFERLFHGNPTTMVKGYIPEIHNPHTDIQTANAEDGQKLLDLGYKLVAPLWLDKNDPYREQQYLYVLRNGGMLPWLSGMFSFTNMRAKGTRHHGENAIGTQKVLARNARADKVVAGQEKTYDPTTTKQRYMVPTFNPAGVAVNYRYMMERKVRDNLLERDSRFDQVIGKLAGSIFDKTNTTEHNTKAAQVLYEDFKENFTKRGMLFLEVGPDSTDPELRSIYEMMPQPTKDAIKKIWGKDTMLVRPENLDLAFGYRKLSISSRFSKDIVDQNIADRAMILMASMIMRTYGKYIKKIDDGSGVKRHMTDEEAERFSKSTAVNVRRLEMMVQEIIGEAKDILVVKNLITSLNNIKSNLITLALYGVNPISGLRDMRIAWVSAEEHQRDSAALFKLELQMKTGYVTGDTSEIELEIARLKEAINNNPIKEMIDAGLMPTIVEDISTEEDPYAYKRALALRTKKYTDKLNPLVKGAAKQLYMTRDTKTYQTLSRIVQLSDFVARYALYQHLTTMKEDAMSKEKAQVEVAEAFINYDVPMHRTFEYLDSVGLFMFTKYFLRVQRVIRNRIKYAPGKLALLIMAESFMGDMPTILDSSVVVRFGENPFHEGPFNAINALGQLPVIALFRQ